MLVPSVSLCYIEEKERRVLFMEQIAVSGDSNRITGEYFERIAIELRQLDCVPPDTSMELFGKHFETPVMMSPLSHLKPLESGVPGMTAMAMGAVLSGSVMWAGMGDEAELEDILSTGAETIKIIKPYADRDLLYRRMSHAKDSGALAVGVDIDHAFGDCLGYPMKPLSFGELAELTRAAGLPFVVKGVLSIQDAEKCVQAGAAGIVVSHHHGIIRSAVPPLFLLPSIKKAVGRELKIFVDCGIDNGLNAFKALALGADAISLGRAVMPVLNESGPEGLSRYVKSVTDELKQAMYRTASPDLNHIDPSVVHILN